MKFLITGGAGFIGSNLVGFLLEKNFSVRVIDNFSTGRKENLKEFEKDIELIEGDIRNYDFVLKNSKGVEVVLHQAALPSVPRSIVDPLTSNDVNVNGTLNVLAAAKNNNVWRVVCASSSSVYGDTPELPKHEGMTLNPLSPYAVTKLTGEKYVKVFADIYGMETVALRYFNVFGPKQDPDSQYSAVIPKFITAMLQGNQPVIFGDGEQSRDFTYISNVIDANYLAATADMKEFGLAVNCASRGRITLNSLVDSINYILHSDILPVYAQPRKGDIIHSFAEIKLAEELFGYNPSVDFNTGLEKTIEYFRQKLFNKIKY